MEILMFFFFLYSRQKKREEKQAEKALFGAKRKGVLVLYDEVWFTKVCF